MSIAAPSTGTWFRCHRQTDRLAFIYYFRVISALVRYSFEIRYNFTSTIFSPNSSSFPKIKHFPRWSPKISADYIIFHFFARDSPVRNDLSSYSAPRALFVNRATVPPLDRRRFALVSGGGTKLCASRHRRKFRADRKTLPSIYSKSWYRTDPRNRPQTVAPVGARQLSPVRTHCGPTGPYKSAANVPSGR